MKSTRRTIGVALAGSLIASLAILTARSANAIPVLEAPVSSASCSIHTTALPTGVQRQGTALAECILGSDRALASVRFGFGGSLAVSATGEEKSASESGEVKARASLEYTGALYARVGYTPPAWTGDADIAALVRIPVLVSWAAGIDGVFPLASGSEAVGAARTRIDLSHFGFVQEGFVGNGETGGGGLSPLGSLPLQDFLLDPDHYVPFHVSKEAQCTITMNQTPHAPQALGCDAFADPRLFFDQIAFDAQLAGLGVESFLLDEFLATAYPPGISSGVVAASAPATLLLLTLGLGLLWRTSAGQTLRKTR